MQFPYQTGHTYREVRFVKQFWFRSLCFRQFLRDEDMEGTALGASAKRAYIGSALCAAAGGNGADAHACRQEGGAGASQNRAPGQGGNAHAEAPQGRASECEPHDRAEQAHLAELPAMAGEHGLEGEAVQVDVAVPVETQPDARASGADALPQAPLRPRAHHERLAQRALRALDRYGYYIAVGICALMVMIGAAAGVSGYGGLDAAPTPLPSRMAEELTGDVDARQASSGGALLGGEAGASVADAESEPGNGASPRLACWPLDGDVMTGHEMDRLIYLETMNVYGTHPGLDIAGERGQVVSACHDGEITACWRESLMGNVVEVRGDDGLVTRYANLLSLELVSEGQRVNAGDAIGAVGASAMSESLMKPHLHFEVLVEGSSVSPLEYLPQRGE
jgi:hypothetical protein